MSESIVGRRCRGCGNEIYEHIGGFCQQCWEKSKRLKGTKKPSFQREVVLSASFAEALVRYSTYRKRK